MYQFHLPGYDRCILYEECPELVSEQECLEEGNECFSADANCSLCDLPGSCDDTAIGIDFVGSRDECLQKCQDLPVQQLSETQYALITAHWDQVFLWWTPVSEFYVVENC